MVFKSLQGLIYFYIRKKPHANYMGGLLVCGLCWGILNAAIPYVLKLIIDLLADIDSTDSRTIIDMSFYLFCAYMALWVAIACVFRVIDWLRLKLNPGIRFDITTDMYNYVIQHSYNYFQNHFAGSLQNKIIDLGTSIVSLLRIIEEGFAHFIGLFIAIGVMFFVHPTFAAILSVWAVIFMVFSIYYSKHVTRLSNILSHIRSSFIGKLVDSISNQSNVRLFASRPYEYRYVSDAMQQVVDANRRFQWSALYMRIGWDVCILSMIGGMVYSLIWLYAHGQVTLGDFSFIVMVTISIFHAMWYLASQLLVFSEDLGKAQQAFELISEPHGVQDVENATALTVSKGEVVFDGVTFAYQKHKTLFTNKNVLIHAGEKIGLVGFSGSGKSSFVNLILRFYDVDSGCIKIDGQDIAKVTQDSLHKQISMIPQDTQLFHRTLMENIRYGNTEASDADVIEASKKAHCHEFIEGIAEGYNALVGERGIKLSGGQRQRIAIARAFLKNAPLLILDEATSALDSVTEKCIQESLKVLMKGKTTLVIAHRLSTLSEMDRLLVFDNGSIIEDGTHDELVKAKGHYFKMWSMQAGGFLPDEA